MAFFKRKDYGRLYVIKLELSDEKIYKIGMTNSERATDRMFEILRSWFNVYRFVPYAELKLDRETANPRKLEKLAHKALKGFQWVPNKSVDGGTEMFTDLNEVKLLHFLKHLDVDQYSDNIHIIGNLLKETDDEA